MSDIEVNYAIVYDTVSGRIHGDWLGGKRIPVIPADENDTRALLLFKDGRKRDWSGMRVNHALQIMEPCPKLARQAERNALLVQLAELDGKRDRALAEAFVTGDKTWLQKHLDTQAVLRAELASKPEL